MLKDPSIKYKAFQAIKFPQRTWPEKSIAQPPRWLSTDLRDGNQSLPDPMGIEEKQEYFQMLLLLGFKEIEVAFPSASKTDFDFTRYAVENCPDDVTIQVLTQSREHLIRRTVESLRGAKNAILHIYLATSDLFRDVVFNMSQKVAIEKAVEAIKLVRSLTKDDPSQSGTNWTLEFSPETFSDTPEEFAVEICEAVKSVWEPSVENPIIFNLPATVEMSTPNVYADQIEYFCTHISEREKVCVSLHCHNDRGCAVAATELGLLAGADRVEGCIFGNGERTGNVDIVTVALNMYTQGIYPNLDFSDLKSVMQVVERCNKIPVPERAPYGGELVVCAFSGSHQDAIKKGFASQEKRWKAGDKTWKIPYLPLDPRDIGRDYEAVIRVNSQSGKGGAAWVILKKLGLDLPRQLQIVFSTLVQNQTDKHGRELKAFEIVNLFNKEYYVDQQSKPVYIEDFSIAKGNKEERSLEAELIIQGKSVFINGKGNGPISSFVDAVSKYFDLHLEVLNYNEHTLSAGKKSKAAAFIELSFKNKNNESRKKWGVGIHEDVSLAPMLAITSVLNSMVDIGEIVLLKSE
ncbi:2-isopropylmalate synthase [Ascoidea rubescens DSM 1968]|uniref:2-isopropylmalate synthase n=1 Tax=Ascoidea rubescens DSM 1968 TaxID=1344418 RepID=A0A1D2VNT9_9ASCO|nr:2-isopropylmalate synthase [Ascoidea rubescens DSM 1968]ODV63254.1 2-isopropylmalate synthase [Ascoidea rubescens DSM 1968]